MKFPVSFRQSLLLHFIIVAVLPLLLLGFFGYRYFDYAHVKEVTALLDTHALNVSREATRFFRNVDTNLALVEKTIHSGSLHNDAEINQYLKVATNELLSVESIFLLDKNYRVTHIGLSKNYDLNRDDYLGLDFSTNQIVTRHQHSSGRFWSDTYLSAITMEPSITLVVPLDNGALLASVSLQRLGTDLTSRLRYGSHDIQFSLLDHHGILIADSRPGLAMQRVNLRMHPEVRNALDHQMEVSGNLHEDGSLLESVRIISEMGWVAYVSLPMQEVNQGVAPLRYLLIGALFFAALLGAVLSFWLSRRMMRPILALRDSVGEVAKGNYDQVLQPILYEELEDLSESFRDMIAAVGNREQSIAESETRFRTVFQTIPDAVMITRLSDGRIVNVNDACLSTFGYTYEEIIEKTTLEIKLWLDLAERDSYLELVHKQGFVENFEMSLQTKAGRVMVGLTSARILALNDETCLLAVVRNITQIKEAETRFVRSESRFRSLVSVMGEGVLIIGYNGEIVQCNMAAERILKMKADDIIGELIHELIHETVHENGTAYPPEERPSSLTLQTGESVANKIMGLPQVDGQTVWLQINTHALGLDKVGKPVAVVASFADVTRLKRIEKDLREGEARLQTLSSQFKGVLEAIPDRILILDAEMRVIWINWFEDDFEAFREERLRTVRCYELPGVHCGPSVESDSALCENCPVKNAFETGRTVSVQRKLADGRTLSLRAFPVFSELGEVINVIEIAQDITESITQQTQTMRTGQLAALGELAAGVAHEINNPINGVINYAQLILNQAEADSRDEDLSQRIIKESERVATIVRELLYFAREETQEVNPTTVPEALDEALALTENQMNKAGITLQTQFPDDLPMIESRSHQIQRLFLNLISNARYALAEKHPDMDPDKILQITGEKVLKDNQTFVRITFRDEGTGIDAEFLPRVMNPFVTSKSSAKGTGLGLSISHEIVQKHGGTISIDSVHGEYTEVVVELPAVK